MSRAKGQNAEKVPGWGLRLVSGLVPWAPSQRSRKGLRLEAPLLPRPRESLSPLSCLSKGVLSHPSSGHPWHSQLRGPACPCSHAYPTPENLCYKTGSSRCQPSPISSGPLQPGSRGGGEPPSLAGPGWLFRGLPFGPWAEAFPGGPYLLPTAAGEVWRRGHSGLPGPQMLLSEASSLLGSFLSSKSCLPPNYRPLYKPSGQTGSLFPRRSPLVQAAGWEPPAQAPAQRQEGPLHWQRPACCRTTPPPKHSTLLPFQAGVTCSPGCKALSPWLCSWSSSQSPLLSTTSGARKSRECCLGGPGAGPAQAGWDQDPGHCSCSREKG